MEIFRRVKGGFRGTERETVKDERERERKREREMLRWEHNRKNLLVISLYCPDPFVLRRGEEGTQFSNLVT